MPKKNQHALRAVYFMAAVFTVFALVQLPTEAATYKQGSSGQAVKDIQTNLKKWGYYSGSVDGIYGSKTVEAVKLFQKKNGLTADGVCGPATLSALGLSSGSSEGGGSSSAGSTGSRGDDLYLLSRIISAEARGEPYIGQVAVGAVIMNRVKHPSFPNSIAGVVYQPGAFTALVDGQFNEAIADSAKKAAQDAMNGWDPTGGAIYYYNPAKSSSKWIFSRETLCVIGKHTFAK